MEVMKTSTSNGGLPHGAVRGVEPGSRMGCVSNAVMTGFTTGIALQIIVGRLLRPTP